MLGARLHVAGAFRCSAPRVSAVTGAHIGRMSRGLSVRGLGTLSEGGLSDPQQSRLEALGMVWDPLEQAWEESFRQLEAYKAEHGDCLVPVSYETADGFKLGGWVSEQRMKYQGKNGGLTPEQQSRLEELGMVWKVEKGPPKRR